MANNSKNLWKKIVTIKDSNCEIKVCIHEAMLETNTNISIYAYAWNTKRLNLFAEYYGEENRIKIVDIQVDKANRKQGYGSATLRILLKIGEMLGVTKYAGFLSNNDINDNEDLELEKDLCFSTPNLVLLLILIIDKLKKSSNNLM